MTSFTPITFGTHSRATTLGGLKAEDLPIWAGKRRLGVWFKVRSLLSTVIFLPTKNSQFLDTTKDFQSSSNMSDTMG